MAGPTITRDDDGCGVTVTTDEGVTVQARIDSSGAVTVRGTDTDSGKVIGHATRYADGISVRRT